MNDLLKRNSTKGTAVLKKEYFDETAVALLELERRLCDGKLYGYSIGIIIDSGTPLKRR